MIRRRRRVRADVAISPHARCRTAALPTPSEPVKLLDEKAAGRSCRTVRQAGPSHRGRRARLARGSRGPGAASNKRPVFSRPTSGHNTGLPESRPVPPGQDMTPDEPASRSIPLGVEASPVRRTWPSVSVTATRTLAWPAPLQSHRRRTARPGKSRNCPRTRVTPARSPRGRPQAGNAARRFRVLEQA